MQHLPSKNTMYFNTFTIKPPYVKFSRDAATCHMRIMLKEKIECLSLLCMGELGLRQFF